MIETADMCLCGLQKDRQAVGAPRHGCGVLQLADGREVAAQAVVVNADPFRLRELAGKVFCVEHDLVLGHAALPPTQWGLDMDFEWWLCTVCACRPSDLWLAGKQSFSAAFNKQVDDMLKDGTSLKINLALKGLPKFK